MQTRTRRRIIILVIALGLAIGVSLFWHFEQAKGVSLTWDNDSLDGLWSTCTNWTTDTCPGASDIAIFDGATTNDDADIDGLFAGSVSGITIESDYSGEVTQSRSITIGSDGFTQDAGTFTGGTDLIEMDGDVALNGGTFTSTSGTMTMGGPSGRIDFDVAAGVTFSANGGEIEFDSRGANVDVDTTLTLNDLEYNMSFNSDGTDIADGDTLVVPGTLTLTNGNALDGTINFTGTMAYATTFDGGDTLLHVTGGAGDIDLGNGTMMGIHLDTARTVNFNNTLGLGFEGPLTIDAGSVVGSSGTVSLSNNEFTLNSGGSFTAPSSTISFFGDTNWDPAATFDNNSGTVVLSTNEIHDVIGGGTITFYDLEIQGTGCKTLPDSDDIFVISERLDLNNGELCGDGIYDFQGNTLIYESGFDGGVGTLRLSVAETLNFAADDEVVGFELNHASAEVNGPGGGANLTVEGDIVLTLGTYNAGNGKTVFEGDDFEITGGTFNNDSGTFRFESQDKTLDGDVTFNNLLSESDITFTAGDTLTVDGLLYFDNLDLDTTVASSAATIDFDGTSASFYNLDVTDITYDHVSAAQCLVGCTDGGGNTNWTFNSHGFIIDVDGDSTSESGDFIEIDVRLDKQPDSDVTLSFASTDTSEGTVSDPSLTFTDANWNMNQTVTVTGVDDAGVNDGPGSYTVTIGAAVSADPQYSGVNPDDIDLINFDDESEATDIEYDDSADYIQENDERTEVNGTVARLLDATFIKTEVDADPREHGDLIYDSVNDSFWFLRDDIELYEYEIAGDTLNSYSNGSTEENWDLAHDDSSRNRFWMTVSDDDEVVAFDDDGTVFTTVALNASASFEDNPTRILFTDYNDGVEANDAIWVGHENASEEIVLVKLSAVDGSAYDTDIATSSYPLLENDTEDANTVLALTYDENNQYVWALVYDSDYEPLLVAIDETDGSPAFGTLAASSFYVTLFDSDRFMLDLEYDDNNDIIWMNEGDHVLGFDTADGSMDYVLKLPIEDFNDVVTDIEVNLTDDLLYISSAQGTVFRYDIGAASFLDPWTAPDEGVFDMELDSDGDLWVLSADIGDGESLFLFDAHLGLQEIFEGYDDTKYWTVVTDAGSAVDSSAETDLTGVTVTETLNGQEIFYSISWDNRTYNAWGSWRPIASDDDGVHGGVDGDWYYRDNANTWTPDPDDSAETAISLAVDEGANNQTTGTTLNGLDETDLESAGGWTDSVDDIYFAASLGTSDTSITPEVDNVSFDFTGGGAPPGGGGSGGGESVVSVSNASASTMSCSADLNIDLVLKGSSIDEFLVADNPDFEGVDWQAFEANIDEDFGTGDDGEAIQGMDYAFELSEGEGDRMVYIKYRSSTGNQSQIITLMFTVDTVDACVDIPEEMVEEDEPEVIIIEPEEGITYIGCEGIPLPPISEEDLERYRFGVSPLAGEFLSSEFIFPGDFVRGEIFSTVYCITANLERRPYVDEITYFTHTRTFAPVKWVKDETLSHFPLEDRMLPREGSTLVKFESSPEVYYFEIDELNPTRGTLRWITTEELAAFIAGDNWADYVIDMSPTLFEQFDFAAPFLSEEDVLAFGEIDISDFRERELFNENSSSVDGEGPISRLIGGLQEVAHGVWRSFAGFVEDAF